MKCQYDIELDVPLGLRRGTMQFENKEGAVCGIMNILGCDSEFSGFIQENEIEVSGELKTSVRNIAYQGTGTINEKRIYIQLRSGNKIYELTGYCSQKREAVRS